MKVMRSLELLADPGYFFKAFRWKENTALFCRLPEVAHQLHTGNAIRAAGEEYAIPMEELFAYCESAAFGGKPLHYLFMTDFCCSTLLARALGSLGGLCCYNEPRALVSLSNEKRRIDFSGGDRYRWRRALPVAVRLMSRTYRPDETALVKEQPLTNYIIEDLLAVSRGGRAIFLYSTLVDYLGAVCRQERRRQYVRHRMQHDFHETRLFEAIAGIDKRSLEDVQLAALHWLTQMYQFLRVQACLPGEAICTLRSDIFLQDPVGVLEKAADYYGIDPAPGDIHAVVAGELFRQHSKQAGRVFDAGARQQQVAQAATQHAAEIAAGLEWAGHILERQPVPDTLPAALVAA